MATGLKTTTGGSSNIGNPNKISNGGSGTAIGNLIRSITGSPAPSKPMVFTVGQGLTPAQTANAYNTITNTNVKTLTAPTKKPVLTPTAAPSGVPGGLLQPKVNNPALQGLNLSLPKSKGSTTDYNGLYGTNQNYSGPGGFNYATPAAASAARTAAPTAKTGTSGGSSYSSSSYSGGSKGNGTVIVPDGGKGNGTVIVPDGGTAIGDQNNTFDYALTDLQKKEEEARRMQEEAALRDAQTNVNQENTYQDALRQFQGEIDATNQVYAERLRQAGLQGQSRLGTTRAENFNAGAVNSSFGNAAQERTQAYNTQQENAVTAEKLKLLGEIEGKARELGNAYYTQKKAAKDAGLENYLGAIKGAKAAKDAISLEIGTGILNGGLTVESISADKLDKIAQNAGVSVQSIKNAYAEAKKAALKDTSKTASVQEYEYAKQHGYTGSFSDYQNEDANRKAVATGVGGLTPSQVNTTVNQIRGNFDNEQVVKNFNVIAEGKQFVDSLPNDSKNPVDHQALIYALAKALDPNSVVREGEYATAQKYAQSWAKSFGKSVTQAISGTGFLSQDAIKNIKATINSRYLASKKNYDNVASEYQRQINDAYNGNQTQITNYAGGYTQNNGGSTSGGNVFAESWN